MSEYKSSFYSHFIADESNEMRVYCPCHKLLSKWNNVSQVDELLDKHDICTKKCTFKSVSGLKTHITTTKKNINSIQADIKNCINNQNNFGYSLKKSEAQYLSLIHI